MQPVRARLYEIFEQENGITHTKTLKQAGISQYYIKQFEESGLIERIKRGIYRYLGEEIPIVDELVEVMSIVPKGVICLLSAASFHELSTINPYTYHVAIERNQMKPVLPDYPPITIYYFKASFYEEGVDEVIINNSKVNVYNMEKTICDLVRYRKKIGNDIMLECIKNYMARSDRNINKLMQCAEKLKVQKLVKQYIEVLV
ncbi:putative AbiEi antitoxin of type IV toxin-antitoxin system [Ureibacillus xyleni]|uniref:Putative AbiEi antitoxin of type IV toxin-antitoxin system n=1 Tax=Ureibacillus xyleni TaxID=614648 RepID=A0A285TIQ6_9BACL|nr:type IV toxin-antitoxin system AbiEi family antitoxin domain-containing protein [Ureibacillus xyleni]SOC21977.1 putative AbiEi antitoxin of type IV toxin-antitoxin system [Ureibacillus xyleni]